MASNNGAFYYLLKAVGWYRSPSENLTKSEVEISKAPQLAPNVESMPNPYGLPGDPGKRFEALMSMAKSDLVAPIIELYAEETTQPDINKGKTIWVECNDGAIEKDLNEMFERIHTEDYLFSIAASIATTGNCFQRILWSKKEGIQQLIGTPANHVSRLWHPTTRKLLGFRWANQQPINPLYHDAEDVFAPWDFIHFRRIYSTDTEYGQGLLDHLYAVWKKLELATDQMVLYRLHTMPNRFAFEIDIGNSDFTDGMEQAHLWKAFMRQSMGMNSQNPSAVGLQSRFDPAAVDSFLVLPIRGAEDKTKITTLQGDKEVPDVMDLEYLETLLLGGSRVPKSYLGRDKENSGLAQASLVSQDIRFARMIRVLRRPIIGGFFRLCQLHLAFKGLDPSQYKVKIKMSRISSIEEEVNIATLEKQAGLANEIAALCQGLEIPNEQIADLIFREYLSVPRYFLDVAKLAMSVNKAMNGDIAQDGMGGGMGGGMGMGGMGGGGMGDGDLDGLGDLGDGLDDLGADGPIDGAGGGTELASKTGGRNNLMEANRINNRGLKRTTRSEAAILAKQLAAISATMKSRSTLVEAMETAKPLLKEARAAIDRTVREIVEIGTSKRVSLVESYTAGDHVTPQLTEAVKKALALGESADYEHYGTNILGSLGESASAMPTSGAPEPEHPDVTARRRARAALTETTT